MAAIEWQGREFQSRTGIVCDCSLNEVELTAEQSTAVFRIFQEALTNALRHSGATRLEIEGGRDNAYFVLSISDNGKGLTEREESQRQSLGILGMRERAHLIGGEITIASAEGRGTVVTLRVPIAGEEAVRVTR
jgi:two-component system sensor histidine kinase UhpB